MKYSLRILSLLLILMGFVPAAHASVLQIRVMAAGIDRSASLAEEHAIDYAKKRAVYLLARKLPVDNVSEKVQRFTPKQYDEIIRGYEVVRTRRENEITYAEVKVSVVSQALRRALGINEEDVAEAAQGMTSRGVLVLPVFVKNDRPYLWEQDNKLRDPLASEVLRQSHGTVMLPGGDPEDLRLIDYQNALSVKGEELKPMFERYGAQEIIIGILSLGKDDKGLESAILLRRLHADGEKSEVVKLTPANQTVETEDARVLAAARAIAAAATQIAGATSFDDQRRLAAATKVPVEFAYANPRELARMQNALRNSSGVLLVEMPTIVLGQMAGIAYVEGDPQKIRESLKKQGIIVTQSGERWKLSLR